MKVAATAEEYREYAVTTDLSVPRAHPSLETAGEAAEPVGLLDRLRRRRLAAEHDRVTARLAELHNLRALVTEAAALVQSGWVRDGWFAYTDERGRRRLATALTAHRMQGRPVVGACLVGAVVHAGGGLGAVRTQPVQRALDLVWHTLNYGGTEPVRWCPPPPVRAAHVRDLTRWNDQRSRTQAEVVALLRDADRVARVEAERLRQVAMTA